MFDLFCGMLLFFKEKIFGSYRQNGRSSKCYKINRTSVHREGDLCVCVFYGITTLATITFYPLQDLPFHNPPHKAKGEAIVEYERVNTRVSKKLLQLSIIVICIILCWRFCIIATYYC
jgi:hypothetical protein